MIIQRLLTKVANYWVPLSVTLLIIITLLSLWPLSSLPKVPGTDKTHHLLAYAALMLPVGLRKPQYWWLMALGFIGYSGLIELLQPYVNRYGEWLDLLANTVGVSLGAVLGLGLNKYALAK